MSQRQSCESHAFDRSTFEGQVAFAFGFGLAFFFGVFAAAMARAHRHTLRDPLQRGISEVLRQMQRDSSWFGICMYIYDLLEGRLLSTKMLSQACCALRDSTRAPRGPHGLPYLPSCSAQSKDIRDPARPASKDSPCWVSLVFHAPPSSKDSSDALRAYTCKHQHVLLPKVSGLQHVADVMSHAR